MRRHLYFYTHLPLGYDTAAAQLTGDPRVWLPAPADPAEGGWEILLRADGALPPKIAERLALVSSGVPRTHERKLLLPVSWQATANEQLFPVFAGDLGLEGLDGAGCHLSLMGTYRPPLSVVGGAADALLGHRVAEAVVRRFVLDVAERLSAPQRV